MPIYVYEILRKDGKSGRRFEVQQSIHAAPLKKHPKTGQPVRRVVSSVNLPKSKYDRSVKSIYGKDSTMGKHLLRGGQ